MARDTRRRLMEIARQLEPRMRAAFVRSFRAIRNSADMELLIAAIDARDTESVLRILGIRREMMVLMENQIKSAFERGGEYLASTIPARAIDLTTGGAVFFHFRGSHPDAQRRILEMGSRLVVEIVEETREVINQTIAAGVGVGRHSTDIGRELVGRVAGRGGRVGGVVGLTSGDAQRVSTVLRGLSTGDEAVARRYLTYRARNRKFDGHVKRLLRDGTPIPETAVSNMTDALSSRYLKLRGDRIAQTEMIDALNAGRQNGVTQLIENGSVASEHVRRVWDATGDARTRDDHLAMEGQTRAWGEPFQAPDGSLLMHPADRSLGAAASQTINCRCYERIEIDWAANDARLAA